MTGTKVSVKAIYFYTRCDRGQRRQILAVMASDKKYFFTKGSMARHVGRYALRKEVLELINLAAYKKALTFGVPSDMEQAQILLYEFQEAISDEGTSNG